MRDSMIGGRSRVPDSGLSQAETANAAPRLLKLPEAAALLAVSPRTLQTIVSMHQMKVVRVGRSVRFDVRDVEDFIQKSKGFGNWMTPRT